MRGPLKKRPRAGGTNQDRLTVIEFFKFTYRRLSLNRLNARNKPGLAFDAVVLNHSTILYV